jgi:hypothetical protein
MIDASTTRRRSRPWTRSRLDDRVLGGVAHAAGAEVLAEIITTELKPGSGATADSDLEADMRRRSRHNADGPARDDAVRDRATAAAAADLAVDDELDRRLWSRATRPTSRITSRSGPRASNSIDAFARWQAQKPEAVTIPDDG